jgi:hypothetical protein
MQHLGRSVIGILAAGMAVLTAGPLAGCGAPAYSVASDTREHLYFKVPASWREVSPQFVSQAQTLLTRSNAGALGGTYAWSKAYAAATSPSAQSLLAASGYPVVYASVQNIKLGLRGALSFNVMRDLLFPVTPTARAEAAAAGEKLPGFTSISYSLITTKYNMRGINELYEYTVGGQPDAFDQTVLTNAATTKLYVLLVQCYQNCFVAHEKQIATVVNPFTVRGA